MNVAFQEKYHIRPNRAAIIISVHDGSLKQGEKIFVDIGGIQENHPGYRIQSFPENKHRFLTFVDAYGTGEYVKVKSPTFKVVPGPADKYEVVAPSTVNTGDTFPLFIRAIDSYGNVTGKAKGTVEVINGNCFNLEKKELDLTEVDNGIIKIEDLAIDNTGIYYFKVKAEDNYY